MKTASGNALLRAYNHAARNLAKGAISASTSVGFIIPNGQKRGEKEGFQVFVKVIRYSDKKLKEDQNSGGLLAPL